MFQGLLEARSDEPRPFHHFTRHAIDHRRFGALALFQKFRHCPLSRHIAKRTCIRKVPDDESQGALEHFQKFADCHATIDCMQIDNAIRPHAFIRAIHDLGHIFFIHQDANDALLSVTIRNFVTDLWHSHRSQAHADLQKAIAIHHDGDFVDNKRFRIFANDNDGPVSADFTTRIVRRLKDAPNEYVVIFYTRAFGRQPILVDF